MPDRTPFLLILALWGAGLGAAGQYAKFSVIFDRLPEIYPDAGVALGFVVSLVGLLGILLGVAAALVVARIRYKRAIIWALWAGAGLSAFQAVFPALPWMLLSRALEGLSHLAIVVAAPTLIAQLSAERHRGMTMTLWSTFFAVTFSLMVALGLPLVEGYGLPALFWAHSLWMAAFAVILAIWLTADVAEETSALTVSSMQADHVAIYRSAHISAPAAGWLFYTFCFLAILTVLPPYIEEAWRAWVMASMPLASIATSMLIGVPLLRVMSAIAMVQLGFVLCVVTLLWLWLAPGLPLACLALAAALGLVQSATFAAVPQLLSRADQQSQAYGAMAQTGNLGNTIGTPALLAVLSVAGFSGLAWTCIIVMLLGIATHAWLTKRRNL